MLVGIADINFVTPTRIQQSAIPVLLVIYRFPYAAQALHSVNHDGIGVHASIIYVCMPQRGRDALVNAPTGSGKTLAYLAPIINDLQAQEPRVSRAEGTHALIIVPTRELCLQIADVLTLILRRYIWLVRMHRWPFASLSPHLG